MSGAVRAYLGGSPTSSDADLALLAAAFAEMFDGAADPADIPRFLERSVGLMTDPQAIAAGAAALRARMVTITAPDDAIDVCGTGGDGAHTLNISTAVAFVLAGAQVVVAKHGNRAMSSRSGAADVLEKLGVQLTGARATLETCLAEAKIGFLFAQAHHPAMRHVAAARRAFGQRTVFNLLGPLSNPAEVKAQLIGVYAPEAATPMMEAAALLGLERAMIVHGAGGLDELSLIAPGENTAVAVGLPPDRLGDVVKPVAALAAQFGVTPITAAALRGGAPEDNAAALRALLQNQLARNHPYRSAVLLNAAAALMVARPHDVQDLATGWQVAEQSLASGAALTALTALIDITNAGR